MLDFSQQERPMTLLQLYQSAPQKLLKIDLSQRSDDEQVELVRHLGETQPREYDPVVLRHILKYLGNVVVWPNPDTRFAAHFLYMAIAAGDAQTVEWIVDTFEDVRTGEGATFGWGTYVEMAVGAFNGSYDVLQILVRHFQDDGAGLIDAVRDNNAPLVAFLLPYSNPLIYNCQPYVLGRVFNHTDVCALLEPFSPKIDALFNLTFTWKGEDEHQHQALEVRNALEKELLEGQHNSEMGVQLYTAVFDAPNTIENLVSQLDGHVVQKIALLWNTQDPQKARRLLGVMTRIDTSDTHNHFLSQFVKAFHSTPELLMPLFTSEQRTQALRQCASADATHTELALQLMEAGADVEKVLNALSEPKGWSVNMPANMVERFDKNRKEAFERLNAWRLSRVLSQQVAGMGAGKSEAKI